MRKHVTIAAFVLALIGYSLAQENYRESQDQAQAVTRPSDAKLSKKDRKRQEKEEKKARKEERKEQKHQEKQQADKQRKQYKDQEKLATKEREHERKAEQKQVASERKKDEKYQRKEDQRAEKEDAREVNRHAEREARIQQAAAAPPRYTYVPRIPISTTATPGLLLAQREVGRAIYSQAPGSDVRVLLAGGNQILLRGSAPTPSLKQRLLQAAIGAARGYSVVDQLAANLVGNGASAATSAAIGGVSNLIHGSGAKESGPEPGPETAPVSAQQFPVDSQQPPPNREAMMDAQALPNSDSGTMPVVLEPGSNACVNLSNSNQMLLTGQVASQPSAELVRRFAHQLASPSVAVVDQLAVRTNGIPSAGNAPQAATSAAGAGTASSPSAPATVMSPGSAVCVSENSGALFLTGTVGSTAELGAVENSVEPLVGSGRLLDHLTIGSMNSGTQIAGSTVARSVGATPQSQNDLETTPAPQNAVEQALHSVPSLANVTVQVAADGLHLSGSVDTTQDEQMAADLARQYASGREVLDNVTVASRAPSPQMQSPRW